MSLLRSAFSLSRSLSSSLMTFCATSSVASRARALSLSRHTRSFFSSPHRLASDTAGSSSSLLSLTLVTPNETFLDNEPVYMVTVPAVTGLMGILAEHAPTIAQLQPGLVTVYRNDVNDVAHRLFVSGGFAVVDNEKGASVTAVEAISLNDLDITLTKEALAASQAALQRVTTDKEKVEAQVSIEVYEAVIAAMESK